MMAVIMSSADSFLNAAAVSLTHDVLKPLRSSITSRQEMTWIRLATIGGGAFGLLFAVSMASVIDILLYAYNFWTPFILVPLVAGILGYQASSKTFWISSGLGVFSTVLWSLLGLSSIGGALVGIMVNFLAFILLRSLLGNGTTLFDTEGILLERERNAS